MLAPLPRFAVKNQGAKSDQHGLAVMSPEVVTVLSMVVAVRAEDTVTEARVVAMTVTVMVGIVIAIAIMSETAIVRVGIPIAMTSLPTVDRATRTMIDPGEMIAVRRMETTAGTRLRMEVLTVGLRPQACRPMDHLYRLSRRSLASSIC